LYIIRFKIQDLFENTQTHYRNNQIQNVSEYPFLDITLKSNGNLSLALFLALYKDIKVSKYVTSELYVIIGLTNESKRLLATFTGKLFNEVV
jgi:hypothetical protein